ncbi:MAG: SRPBCC family protein [Myxococcaceae bacterium]
MKLIKKSVRINAPLNKVYEYATQPQNLPEIWPSMMEVANIKRTADGGHSYDWVYKMAGMRFNGHADTRKVVQNKMLEVENKAGIKSVFRWNYTGNDGATEINLEVEYEIPVPLLGKFVESFLVKLNEREAETVLHNLRERMEAGEIEQPRPPTGKEKRI